MVNVSTDYSKENREKYLMKHNSYFSTISIRDGLDATDRYIIKKIDGATINNDNISIAGKFGITHITNISAGAKTLINIRNILKKSKECYVDITSCGDSCIDLLVDIINEYDSTCSINLLTCLNNYSCNKKIRINVDNEYTVDCFSDIG